MLLYEQQKIDGNDDVADEDYYNELFVSLDRSAFEL